MGSYSKHFGVLIKVHIKVYFTVFQPGQRAIVLYWVNVVTKEEDGKDFNTKATEVANFKPSIDLTSFHYKGLKGVDIPEDRGVNKMQDTTHAIQFTLKSGDQEVLTTALGVFEGHGTLDEGISRHIAANLPDALSKRLRQFNKTRVTEESIYNAIMVAFGDITRSSQIMKLFNGDTNAVLLRLH
ncbi:MAG: hypothetical protein OXC48_10230, partial [Endozoicomonadaceae bacterium]|nr:hypothetical protein [Endozoicomonadaceae bacterium]